MKNKILGNDSEKVGERLGNDSGTVGERLGNDSGTVTEWFGMIKERFFSYKDAVNSSLILSDYPFFYELCILFWQACPKVFFVSCLAVFPV